MLKAETWITPEEAVAYGFATQIAEADDEENGAIMNDAMRSIMAAVKRPAHDKNQLGEITISTDDSVKEFMQVLSDSSEKYGSVFELAAKFLEQIENDPELLPKLKAVADLILATNPAPKTPASVENKGFFGFA